MNEIIIPDNNNEITIVKQRLNMVHELYTSIMKPDEHFGRIPGTKKDTLFKSGAEKLCVLFKLVPKIENETKTDLGNGHREIEMTIGLYHRVTNEFWGQGTGSCSTMESKYRYRSSDNFEVTGESIPKDAKDNKAKYRKQGYGMKKIDGVWEWVHYLSEDKTENPDIADTYNTVRKMAYKRALVSATITATGVSDIFTQDVEDFKTDDNIDDNKNNNTEDRKELAKKQYDKFYNSLDDGYKFELKDMTDDERFKLFAKCEWNIKKLDEYILDIAKKFDKTIHKSVKSLKNDLPFGDE